MKRYIDADNLLKKLYRIIDFCEKDKKVNTVNALFQVGDAIMDCKTADVKEVRHGKWEVCGLFDDFAKCSCCGYKELSYHVFYNGFKYCPMCGAELGGDTE